MNQQSSWSFLTASPWLLHTFPSSASLHFLRKHTLAWLNQHLWNSVIQNDMTYNFKLAAAENSPTSWGQGNQNYSVFSHTLIHHTHSLKCSNQIKPQKPCFEGKLYQDRYVHTCISHDMHTWIFYIIFHPPNFPLEFAKGILSQRQLY